MLASALLTMDTCGQVASDISLFGHSKKQRLPCFLKLEGGVANRSDSLTNSTILPHTPLLGGPFGSNSAASEKRLTNSILRRNKSLNSCEHEHEAAWHECRFSRRRGMIGPFTQGAVSCIQAELREISCSAANTDASS